MVEIVPAPVGQPPGKPQVLQRFLGVRDVPVLVDVMLLQHVALKEVELDVMAFPWPTRRATDGHLASRNGYSIIGQMQPIF